MYSKKIQAVLKKKGMKTGERIKIKKLSKHYEGLLMPKSELGDPNCIIIKLDSGYNVGIRFDEKTEIKKVKQTEPKEVKEEKEFELGKIKKKLLKVRFDPKKPPISLIATGGTIASRVDYRTGGVYMLMDPHEFLYNVPELKNIVNIKKISRPFTKASEDMDYTDWQTIAKEAAKHLNSDINGVIITHGTDTLHFTAAALSFMLRDLSKPVVLTGAQKSSDRGSSDAGMNIICSSYAAISNIAEVGICMHGSMNDDYCLLIRGTHCRKMNTIRRDAFRPINELPLAKVWPAGKVEILNKDFKKRSKGNVRPDVKFEPKVALVKAYPGSEPGIIDFLIKKGYKGFVVEGLGLGHVPTFAKKSWIETIKNAVNSGIPFVVTSQTIYGRVNPNVYTNLRILYHEAGAIPGEDMLSEVAYVKLGWVLGHTKNMKKIKEMMLTNYSHEITERTLPETFLY
jgi:glutamyl-tRNA(Gln) amidotransferase subunit D